MSIGTDSWSLILANCHSLLLSFILMLKLPKWGPFKLVSVLFWHDSINIWAPRLILYLPCSSPEINHFSKELGSFYRKMMLRFGVLIDARVSLCLNLHSDALGNLYLHFNMYIYFRIYLFILTFPLFLFLTSFCDNKKSASKGFQFWFTCKEPESCHSVLIRSRKLNRKDNQLFLDQWLESGQTAAPQIERQAITGSVKSPLTTVERDSPLRGQVPG